MASESFLSLTSRNSTFQLPTVTKHIHLSQQFNGWLCPIFFQPRAALPRKRRCGCVQQGCWKRQMLSIFHHWSISKTVQRIFLMDQSIPSVWCGWVFCLSGYQDTRASWKWDIPIFHPHPPPKKKNTIFTYICIYIYITLDIQRHFMRCCPGGSQE